MFSQEIQELDIHTHAQIHTPTDKSSSFFWMIHIKGRAF